MSIFAPFKPNSNTATETGKNTDATHEADISVNNGGNSRSNPLLHLTETQLRDLCRHHIDTFENWSRRLLDETLKSNYGDNYFNCMVSDTQPLVKSGIKKRIEQRIVDNPGRFPRQIDAILMEDIEYFFVVTIYMRSILSLYSNLSSPGSQRFGKY